ATKLASVAVTHPFDASPVADSTFQLHARSFFSQLGVSPAATIQATWLGQPVQLRIADPGAHESASTGTMREEVQNLYMVSSNTKLQFVDSKHQSQQVIAD